ncbi:hypothetical protein [Streptomyces sp. ICC4]|uniref:hypothetical protein n=1 Tax=Streptomyces sp. ICC4 TaxID=2099584 RepID=UPI0019551222|nr:hypothetical protein [Streptomyces sp. ICC4]
MHPTRTTTKLLLGVACAVSAVSGCVNVTPAPVQPATAPGAPGEPPRHEPRGGPGATPVVVQAPALEALKAVPGRPAGPAPSATGRRVAERSAAPAAQAGTPDRGAGSGAPAGAPPVPDIPEPRRPGDPHRDRADGRPGGHRPVLLPDQRRRQCARAALTPCTCQGAKLVSGGYGEPARERGPGHLVAGAKRVKGESRAFGA